ncbi:MAG: Asp-tRNA(Asn)/Glu-tRNA(Gln) amidotransferase subunit GatA [Patescibacteria group bacterium]
MKLPKSIKENQENLLNKVYSAVELTQSYLDRIEKYDKELNAFITVTADIALAKAAEIDKLVDQKGKQAFVDQPLLGSVVAHKDIYLTKGIKTTAASNLLKDFIAPYSASVVERLEAAGVIMIGKLNCDAWAHGSSGENSDFGPAKNPWNIQYSPGGSSSGSGVAPAADFSLFSTGTDTCGSIRLPANYCGLVGLKPTYGAVSRYGVIAMASSLDTVGHITKTVEDSKRIFEVTRGSDGYDSTVVDSPKYNEKLDPGKKIRIGIPKEFFIEGLSPEVKDSVMNATKKLEKMGAELVEVSLPHTKYAIDVYYVVQPAEVSSNLGRFDGVRFGENRDAFGEEAKRRIMLGTYVLSAGFYDAYYLKAMKVRSIIIKELNSVFKDVDALIAPVAPTPAFKLGEKISDPLQMYLTDIFAATANLSGIPSLAIPSGFTQDNLPLGFQLMAPRFSENLLFDMGMKFEEQVNILDKQPNLES